MSDKIQGVGNRPTPIAAPQPAARTRNATASPGKSGEVAITDTAKMLALLEQRLAGGPPVDEARVAIFQAEIERGTYQPQPERIADQLIQLEQAMRGLEP